MRVRFFLLLQAFTHSDNPQCLHAKWDLVGGEKRFNLTFYLLEVCSRVTRTTDGIGKTGGTTPGIITGQLVEKVAVHDHVLS